MIEAMFGGHIFSRVRKEHGGTYKLTRPHRPWTNGQAEQMDQAVKKATIESFHD